MKYNELTIKKHKSARRVGRGIAAGQGKTAGRGTKGQKARAGWSLRAGFAGGQNPLMQQLPKLPGFKSYRYKTVNVFTDQLQALKENTIDSEVLTRAGLISNPYLRIKLLNRGQFSKKIVVKLPAASAAAIATIETAGGTFEKVERTARTVKLKGESK
jgi:large subunit ribosomal protein L15